MKHPALAREEATQHVLLVLIFSAAALVSSAASGQDFWADLHPRPRDVLGTLSCTSATCHGRTEPRHALAGLSRQEYQHWLGGDVSYAEGRRHYDPRARLVKNHADPHALAGSRIQEPRFQEVLRRLSNLPDGRADPLVYARCAQCHDPLGLAEQERSGGGPISVQGIGCESCHGGARQWIAAHYQQGITRQALGALGMIDTKNIFLRARLCASCHVGSADQDMNHDMIAAGHPPLRFEMASHQALLERKHWDDSPRRIAEPNYEVQLWAAGRIASADAALSLLESRARQAMQRNAPWPEFAESNCFACHQPLRPLAGNPSGKGLTDGLRGTPSWQTWNVSLVPALLTPRPLASDELPPPTPSLDDALGHIRAQMARTLAPPPDEIARLAADARSALRLRVHLSPLGEVLAATGSPLGVEDVLPTLITSSAAQEPNWEGLCQQLAAILSVERVLRDGVHRRRALESLIPGQFEQPLAACDQVRQRARRVAWSLRFTSNQFEWPAVLARWPVGERATDSAMSMAQVTAEIDSLVTDLRRISATIDY